MILALTKDLLSEGLHDFCDIDASRTSNGTGMTGCALPVGIDVFELVHEAELRQVHDLAGAEVHLLHHGAHPCAGGALHAFFYTFATEFIEFLDRFDRDSLGSNR